MTFWRNQLRPEKKEMFDWFFNRQILTLPYIANYGYTDASGDYYITIDSQKCDGCGKCVDACPEKVFEVITDDYDNLVAKVRNEVVRNLKYICGPCKPVSGATELKCLRSCEKGAISHSW